VHGIREATTMIKSFFLFSLTVILWLQLGFGLLTTLAIVLGIYLSTGGWNFATVVWKTLPRDGRALYFLINSKLKMKKIQQEGGNLVTLFKERVKEHPNKIAFIGIDGITMTFREVDEFSNQVANYFHGQGYRKGDVVAIFMENCPEYPCIWLGLTKIGALGALINFNLRNESLAHCINISGAKAVVFSSDLADAIKDIQPSVTKGVEYLSFGDKPSESIKSQDLHQAIKSASNLPPPRDQITRFNDKLFYIYTSGTTGLPKAAVVIHSRFFYMAYSTHYFFGMSHDDVIYDTLPLYHTAGGILGMGQCLLNGCTVVIRKKFSASRFWDDCVQYNCTVAQYIGEICRYLLAQPNRPAEDQHRVKIVFGNGLRPQIWENFQKRFRIQTIGEFYGATEGNANIINIDNKVGAVGFTTRIAPFLYPVTLIRVDEATGEPIRDRNGVCVQCEPGEPGELVGKIVKGDPLREFDGYANSEATKKKVTCDVFKKGDQAFLTGDILVMDELGYMYFRDRTGDTYRWRGENVSTSEVEAVISNVCHLSDATVYGVEVPGAEGRAGMAAIVDEDSKLDFTNLFQSFKAKLPAYAIPLFIRIVHQADTTSTFKLRKVDYRKEGFDPNKIKDNLYFLDAKKGQYIPLTPEVFQDIQLGKIRL